MEQARCHAPFALKHLERGITIRKRHNALLARAQVIAVLDNSFEDERATGAIEYCSPLTD
jgi:hypothetical protein